MKSHGWAWVALALSATATAGEVKVTMSGKDGLSGTGTVVTKVNQDGSMTQTTRFAMKGGSGPSMTVIEESQYSSAGRPIRRLMKMTSGASVLQSFLIEYGKNGAVIKANSSGVAKTETLKLPQGRIESPSQLWFVKTKPKVGQTDEYFYLEYGYSAWQKRKAEYRGPEKVKIGGGKTVTGHLIVNTGSKMWVDDKGDPLRIEVGGGVSVVRA